MHELDNWRPALAKAQRVLTRLVFAAIMAAMACSLSFAQSFTPDLVDPITEKWRWVKFPELEGKGVRYVVEDRFGTVWFGVDEGIITYDGREWTRHGPDQGLPAVAIEHVSAMHNGDIYCASRSGIYRYINASWETVFESADDNAFELFQLREIADGSLLIATNLGVLQVKENAVMRIFTPETVVDDASAVFGNLEIVDIPSLADNAASFHISDILEDSRDNLWFAYSLGSSGALIRFKQRDIAGNRIQNVEVFKSDGRTSFGEDQKLIETIQGEIWVVSRSIKVGINMYDGRRWKSVWFNDMFGTDEYCTAINQTPDGTIWIASLGKLYTHDHGDWRIYRSSDSHIPTNKIILANSNDQRLWISGFKAQTYSFDYSRERWSTFRGLNFQCTAEDGARWFIDASGKLIRQSGNDWTTTNSEENVIDAPVRVISTSNGEIWAAGSHKGVAATAVLRDGQWSRHLHPNLSWGIDYRAVLEAFDGSLWFGGAVDFDEDRGQIGGVLQMVYDSSGDQSWIHHRYRENGLTQSNAYGIGQSRDSLIWIGGGSLMYYDGTEWNKAQQPLLQDFVNVVQSTPSGLLLVGSRYYGVFMYNGETWSQYNTENGLLSNTILAIHGEAEDLIFAATQTDISRFDGQNWVNNVFPDQMTINFEGGTINSSSDGSVWINKSPREWKRRAFVGEYTADSENSFVAYSYRPDSDAPDTRVVVYEENVSRQGNTLITWTGEDFMSATPAEQLSYSYRLNGGAWSPFARDQHHTFIDLSNGTYTLEVRARDMDMNIDPSPAQIEFRVLPPVWKQAWFLLLLLAFLITIIVFEYRVITKNRTLHVLNNSLSSINHELQAKNRQIELQNAENVQQQQQILEQKKQLEESFGNLRSQNEEIQFQRDKLAEMVVQIEELNKSKIMFFTNVSHELRTPLTLILGPAHELQNSLHSISADKREKLYKIIERNAFKLLKLINQLLEMRRIENNLLELNMTEGNLGKFVHDITLLFENLASERMIDFRFDNHLEKKSIVFDRDKVEKIVTNLVSNAFKHTPTSGRITLSLIPYRAEETGEEYVRISVEDNGTGISADRMPHIFERYYSDNSDRLSSGIGLTYIKDLVEVHGGTIAVESQKGEGTVFTVDLPADLDVTETLQRVVDPTDGLGMSASEVAHLFSLIEPDVDSQNTKVNTAKKSILIVENDADLLDFLSVILEEKYNVYKAANGLAGLDVARNNAIDLVLSDIMMPQMDGLEMCHHLKSDLVTSHIPVILLTAKAMDGHRMQGYIQGADAYLTKPFNPNVLQSRIENLLAQRTQLREVFTRDFLLQPKHVELESVDDELLHNIVRIMEEHIDEADFNVNKMCHMVGMSHTHFIRKVKQLTGKKPIDLLKAFRLKRGKDLLAQNSANIAEIAYMVGYNVPNSFSRAFKKEFGISPKEYADQFADASRGNGMRAPTADDSQDSRMR